MDPASQAPSLLEQSTPEKTPTLKWVEPPGLAWAEQLLLGCHPRVAVMDVWPSHEVAAAAKTLGISYISPSSLKSAAEAYDCVVSLLPKRKHAMTFCYLALRAWHDMLPGGHMVLMLNEECFAAMKRFLPPHPRVVCIEEHNAFIWRKPIAKGLGNTTRHRTQKISIAR